MKLLSEHHSFTGMQRDFNVLKHPPTFLYNAKNIRLTAREDNTLLAISNEKGTTYTKLTIVGDYLGSCKLNKYLVIFTHVEKTEETEGCDYIYRVDLEDESLVILYSGNLGFKNPIDAVGNYENDNIQKVYWVDGENQPRLINIAGEVNRDTLYPSDTSFDFIPKLKLQENVAIKKILGIGEFPSGVIQYAFTYYNKWGQESNIFHTTPLQYISSKGRAGSPEEKIANAFKISITNLDLENFEYLRIYSILRTSLNGTPLVKRVQDIKVLGNRFTFDKDNIISSSQYYFIEEGPTKIDISLDGGNSYVDNIHPVATTIEEAWNKDYIPGNRNQENKESSIPKWNEYILGTTSESKDFLPDVYIFNKKDYPLLTLKLGEKTYYSWGDNDSTDRIYLGKRSISDNAYTWIIVGENYSNKTTSNITSGNATPKTSGVEYIDTGTSGDIIDPTELLYKGGESISASSIAVLDNTLFLGDIKIKRDFPNIKDSLLNTSNNITSCTYERSYLVDGEEMPYIDTLNTSEDDYPGATSFKSRELYRLGIQFQHETGKWSEPYWLGDKKCENNSSITDGNKVLTAGFKYTLSDTNIIDTLKNAGYLKARPVFAYPSANDRTILCQGVLSPTVYRNRDRFMNSENNKEGNGAIYAQSSWLFRTYLPESSDKSLKGNNVGKVSWNDELYSQYNENIYDNIISPYIFSTEISGIFDKANTYRVDINFVTLHSPDLIFDDSFSSTDFSLCGIRRIGTTSIANTYSDIDIKTSSDTIGSSAGGFLHKSIKSDGHYSLVSGLFYEDKIVDDVSGTPPYLPYSDNTGSIQKWFVSLWQKNGSLNNDVNRENRSAQLLKKVISNFKFCKDVTLNINNIPVDYGAEGITLFNDDQVSIVKSGDKIYMGNVSTMVTPTSPSPHYFNGDYLKEEPVKDDEINWKLDRGEDPDSENKEIKPGVYKYDTTKGSWTGKFDDNIGDRVRSLVSWREGISIKYKSTPHLVAKVDGYSNFTVSDSLVLAEVQRTSDADTMFGGTSDDALKAATWIPCGPAVNITNNTVLEYKWGDTYFQRFDCLKTYPFTKEDVNQVVEIASFMVETRINLGGRYDRNKGQTSNLNASPENFNLINPVYSQPDNFFSYRILDSDYYNTNNFPNQITWSKAKQSGAEIDLWTNITMASTYDVDGSKGSIKALKTWKDNLYCFQDKGISNILFNSRVQIPVSDGVPIELGNSNKLEGHRYLTEGYGCSNKELIKSCNSGLYFIDDTTNHLMYIGDGIRDVSINNNMSSWFNNNVINRIEYDSKYSDIYLVGEDDALCFSETLGQFTSFFDYGNISFIESYKNKVFTLKNNSLYKMFEGKYNCIFDDIKKWEFTFITNGANDGTQDLSKIFSTIDYRMDISNSDGPKHNSTLDYIIAENGYQSTGECGLTRLKSVVNPKSYHHKDSNLQKKFRTWRIQIPRNDGNMDRIRDNWCKITLGSNGIEDDKAVLYDLNVQYYV